MHKIVLPMLIKAIQDPVPRVQSCACEAFINFVQGCTSTMIMPFAESLMSIHINYILNGISILKEKTLNALVSLGLAMRHNFLNIKIALISSLDSYLTLYA